jgi:protein N-terminal amidase
MLTFNPGYNLKSLGHISSCLEFAESGISAALARQAALKHDCTVIVGYPKKIDPSDDWPSNPEYYNSAIVIDGDGENITNYRKSHLYYTDETWALEGSGFWAGRLPRLGPAALGICIDLKYGDHSFNYQDDGLCS